MGLEFELQGPGEGMGVAGLNGLDMQFWMQRCAFKVHVLFAPSPEPGRFGWEWLVGPIKGPRV